MSERARRVSSVRGALLAIAAGDALGWPQELRGGLVGGQRARDRAEPEPAFRLWTRRAGHYTRRYDDSVLPGEYSDDTQLMLSVARACMAGDRWLDHLTRVELPAWPVYQRGGGGAVLSAANAWAAEVAPWRRQKSAQSEKVWSRYVGAGANGVAMRIAPHVIVASNHDDLLDRVFRDGITTHGHPRALVGALTYAVTLRRAFDTDSQLNYGDLLDAAKDGLVPPDRVMHLLPHGWGSPEAIDLFAETWQTTNREMAQLVDQVAKSLQKGALSNAATTLEELGCTDAKINGAGTVTAAAAIYAASRFAARPMHGLLATTFLRKGDTDTLGSMTGALLGAVHGESWLGELGLTVQDAGYIVEVAEVLSAGDQRAGAAAPPPEEASSLRKEWRRVVAAINPPTEGAFVDGRQYSIVEVKHIGEDIRRLRIRLEGGQTATVDASAPRADRTPMLPVADAPSGSKPISAPTHYGPLGSVTTITAFTPDLNRATAFYARLLGRDLDTRLDEVRITDWFVLRRPAGPTDAMGAGLGIIVAVHDLHAAAQRVGADPPALGARHLNTRDPDGRYVRVEQIFPVDQSL